MNGESNAALAMPSGVAKQTPATVVVPLKHHDGHHLGFPREFILFFQRAGWRILVVADEKCRPFMPQFDHFHLPGVQVEYRRFRKIDGSGLAAISRIARDAGTAMVFFPTLDEWLIDFCLPGAAALRGRGAGAPLLAGVLHYVAKANRRGLVRRAFDRLQLFCARRVLASVRFAPLFALSVKLVADKVAGICNPIQLPHPMRLREGRSPGAGAALKVLIFGDIRENKDVAAVVASWSHVVQQSKVPVALVIAGAFSDAVQKRRIERCIRGMPVAARDRLQIIEGFAPEAEKERLFAEADVVLLPCVGEDYRRGMDSGLLFDALAFARPVIYSEELGNVPGIGEIGARFTVGDDRSLLDALDRITANYTEYAQGIRRRALAHRAGFENCMQQSFAMLLTSRGEGQARSAV